MEKKASITKSLVEFIVDNKQLIRLVESRSFAAFLKHCNRHYKLPSRQTIVRSIHDQYAEWLCNFLAMIEKIPGRVALTLDGWSSRVTKGYLVVTLHWIDNEWCLKNAVLEFKYFPAPHNLYTTSELVISITKKSSIITPASVLSPLIVGVRCLLPSNTSENIYRRPIP